MGPRPHQLSSGMPSDMHRLLNPSHSSGHEEQPTIPPHGNDAERMVRCCVCLPAPARPRRASCARQGFIAMQPIALLSPSGDGFLWCAQRPRNSLYRARPMCDKLSYDHASSGYRATRCRSPTSCIARTTVSVCPCCRPSCLFVPACPPGCPCPCPFPRHHLRL